jgi:hypothetical protein
MGRWIESKRKLPRKSGDVLTYGDGVYQVLHYSAVHKTFNAFDESAPDYPLYPTHWQSLPKEPEVHERD